MFLLFIFSVQLNCLYAATFSIVHLVFRVKDNDGQLKAIVTDWKGIISYPLQKLCNK